MLEIEDTPIVSTDTMFQAITNSDEFGLNKQLAGQVFSLWMISPLLGNNKTVHIYRNIFINFSNI